MPCITTRSIAASRTADIPTDVGVATGSPVPGELGAPNVAPANKTAKMGATDGATNGVTNIILYKTSNLSYLTIVATLTLRVGTNLVHHA